MSRLVDADKNREDFKKAVYSILKDDFSTSKVKFNKIMTAFDSMPTAYSIDKVVKELEIAKDKVASEDYCRSINDKEKCDGRDCFKCCAEYLIEIVKVVGQNDNRRNQNK